MVDTRSAAGVNSPSLKKSRSTPTTRVDDSSTASSTPSKTKSLRAVRPRASTRNASAQEEQVDFDPRQQERSRRRENQEEEAEGRSPAELITPPVLHALASPSTPSCRQRRASSSFAVAADQRRHSAVATTPLKTPAVPARRTRSHSVMDANEYAAADSAAGGAGEVGRVLERASTTSSFWAANRCRSMSMTSGSGVCELQQQLPAKRRTRSTSLSEQQQTTSAVSPASTITTIELDSKPKSEDSDTEKSVGVRRKRRSVSNVSTCDSDSSDSGTVRMTRQRARSLSSEEVLQQKQQQQSESSREAEESIELDSAEDAGTSPRVGQRRAARKSLRRRTLLQKIDEEVETKASDLDHSEMVLGAEVSSNLPVLEVAAINMPVPVPAEEHVPRDDSTCLEQLDEPLSLRLDESSEDVERLCDDDMGKRCDLEPVKTLDCTEVVPSGLDVVMTDVVVSDNVTELVTDNVTCASSTESSKCLQLSSDSSQLNSSSNGVKSPDIDMTENQSAEGGDGIDVSVVSVTDDSALGHEVTVLSTPPSSSDIVPARHRRSQSPLPAPATVHSPSKDRAVLRALDIINSMEPEEVTKAATDEDGRESAGEETESGHDTTMNDSGVSHTSDSSDTSWRSLAAVPRGQSKSWRPWKQPRAPASSVRVPGHVTAAPGVRGGGGPMASYIRRMAEQQQRKQLQLKQQLLKDERRQRWQQLRERQAANRARAAAGERRGEVVQLVKNPNKIKRMKKKQLRTLQKRDLTVVEKV